jgi:hypothetical protein
MVRTAIAVDILQLTYCVPEENFPVVLCVALNGMVKQRVLGGFGGWNQNF